jgi:glycerol transport system permease protein
MKQSLLLAPAVVVMLLSGVVPMGFVAFYSVHDTFAGNDFVFVGTHWFRQVLTSPDFYAAFGKSLAFSALALAIQLPLGIAVALKLPKDGWFATAAIVIIAIPLLTPTIVVGYLWKTLTLPDAGLLYEVLAALGVKLDMNSVAGNWLALVLMDAWHWTGLVVLLSYAGLKAIPEDYYRAASIDGASRCRASPLHGQLHDLRRGLCAYARRPRRFHHIPCQ